MFGLVLKEEAAARHSGPGIKECFKVIIYHTNYSRNNMGQKCEGNCGLWVLYAIVKKIYFENLKKIVGGVLELPAK